MRPRSGGGGRKKVRQAGGREAGRQGGGRAVKGRPGVRGWLSAAVAPEGRALPGGN